MIFSGNLLEGLSAPSISLDTHALRFTSNVVLFTGAGAAELFEIVDRLRKLKICVLDWIDQHPNFRRADGKTLIVKLKFNLPDPMS